MQKALVVLLSAGQLCAGAAAGQAWAAGSPAHSIDPCYQALSCSLAAFLGALQGPWGGGSNWTAELLNGLGRVDNTPCFRTMSTHKGQADLEQRASLFGQKP